MLTDRYIQTLKPKVNTYKKHDLKGLFIVITSAGNKIWRYRYRIYSTDNSETIITENVLCFGKYPKITLKYARYLRDQAEHCLKQGIDPRIHIKDIKRRNSSSHYYITVNEVCDEFFSSFSHDKASSTIEIWERNLRNFKKEFGNTPIVDITKKDIRLLLGDELNMGKIQTAQRILWAIRKIFRWAVAMDYRPDDPTTFLEAIFPKPKPIQHHAAVIEPSEVADLLVKIHSVDSSPSVKYCLMLLPYVPLRSAEIRGAKWDEIDLNNAVWVIPASRSINPLDGGGTKTRRDLAIPLSDQVINLFTELKASTGNCELCFPGRDSNKIISDVALHKVLSKIGFKGRMTLHGFRTIFSTIVNTYKNVWGISSDAIEFQLDHSDRNPVRRAYNRSDYWDERKKLMQLWADYLDNLLKNI